MKMGLCLQPWLKENCTWMEQAALFAAFRNCDTVDSLGPHKILIRGIRMSCIKPSFPANKLSSGFIMPTAKELISAGNDFTDKFWDKFPMHFVTHLMHAIQILSYRFPVRLYRKAWSEIYIKMVRSMHLQPESFESFSMRLLGDVEYIKTKLRETCEE